MNLSLIGMCVCYTHIYSYYMLYSHTYIHTYAHTYIHYTILCTRSSREDESHQYRRRSITRAARREGSPGHRRLRCRINNPPATATVTTMTSAVITIVTTIAYIYYCILCSI